MLKPPQNNLPSLTPYQQLSPHPSIANCIKCFWAIRKVFAPGRPLVEVLPDSYAELIFSIGAPCYLAHNNQPVALPNPFLVGLLESPIYFRASGELRIIAVRIFPWAIAAVTGSVVPVEGKRFDPDQFTGLVAGLNNFQSDNDDTRALNHLHDYFLGCLKTSQPDQRLTRAGEIIHRANGNVDLNTLAGQTNTSRRNLQRLFERATGQSPKAVARKVRFERVRDKIWAEPAIPLGRLAYEFGFTDQAHLNREFRHFAAKTPGRFAEECTAAKKVLQEQSVAFLHGTKQNAV